MNTLDLTPVFRSAIGFDRMANLGDNLMIGSVDSQYNWPPFYIEQRGRDDYRITIVVAGFGPVYIEQRGRDDYRITMVVAGFGPGDLDITNKKPLHVYRLLRYFGKVDVDVTPTLTISGRQIAGRNFKQRFQLDDFIEALGAVIEDGLLHISLRREVPEIFSGVKCLKP